ncbi:HIRA-interacting protein 3 [Enoplosus armatus]|uniref:HIRA-interacting protein 3 n=1 Tax=Enoplosus armatus TaxID=215367 RepID=UPI003992201B
MMVSVKDTQSIRRFVCRQLRDEPDLSTLTLRILKGRYLAHVQHESLSPEARHFMKRVVEEELMKMQANDGSELDTKKPQNKRKREKENDKVMSGREDEDESRAKKSRCQPSSSSESEDKEDCKTGSEEREEVMQIKSGSGDEDQEVKKSQRKTNGNRERQMNSEDSTDEEINEAEKEGSESDCPKEMVKKSANTKNGETRSRNTSQGKKTSQSDEENESDTDQSERSDKINGNDSSDNSEKEEKVSVEKKNNDPDSDSSSLPSVEGEQDSVTENTVDNKKKKTVKKGGEKSARSQKDDNKAVVRLKRYIALCGVRLNYKKLLDGCRSIHSQVAVLKKELEDLGIHGQPSIEKCKKVRMKREEAQELAELDVSNIIATQGRPKRRASAWQEQHDPPSPPFNTRRGRRRGKDWANLQGIISDDADSD